MLEVSKRTDCSRSAIAGEFLRTPIPHHGMPWMAMRPSRYVPQCLSATRVTAVIVAKASKYMEPTRYLSSASTSLHKAIRCMGDILSFLSYSKAPGFGRNHRRNGSAHPQIFPTEAGLRSPLVWSRIFTTSCRLINGLTENGWRESGRREGLPLPPAGRTSD